MRRAPTITTALTICIVFTANLPADEPADEPAARPAAAYVQEVRPLLHRRCFACHGALKQESGLRLDTVAAMRTGGDSGPAIQANDAAGSLLVERISSQDEFERMPPEGEPLSPDEIAAVIRWIDAGAPKPENDQPEDDPRDHWAFQPPRQGPLPGGESSSVNPVDAFIAAERTLRGLQPVGPVDRGLLLRRVYLDLTGLPPTRHELREFLADQRADSYERVVDRLLDSPHYGERWGRHWMDVWRYSDWYGLGQQLRYSQKHIWHWRAWIVESLNADRGYDQMVREMLAADELAPTDRQALRATGFLARNYFLFNRTTWLDQTIEHTSKAFLGLTINCAKCHDHKYDPISHEDYYRLRAVFEPHQVRLDPLPGTTDLEQDGLPRVFDAHPDAPTFVHVRGNALEPDESRRIEPGLPAWLVTEDWKSAPVELPPEAHFPSLSSFVLADHLREAERQIVEARTAVVEAETKLAAAERAEIASAEQPRPMPGELLLADSFDEPCSELWKLGPGQWKYESGQLIQSETGATRRYIRSQITHPADFLATLRFQTTGGERWKSVGICFDVDGDREKMVYLSAVSPGSKLQVSYNDGGGQVYPPSAVQSRSVPLNQPITLQIAVRGRLVNAAVDGEHALAFPLPVDRRQGRIDLIAFDAAAAFDEFKLRRLPASFAMHEPGGGSAAPASVPQARRLLQTARAKLATAELRPAALQSAHAADRARHGLDPHADLSQCIQQAAQAARNFEAARAAQAVAEADQALGEARDDAREAARKKLADTRQQLEKATAAVAQPGVEYTSLRVSSKAAEGPAESETSRRQPYPKTSTGRRTALALAITDRRNPLTARVAVNHIWLRHFGQPLVDSTFDFGLRSARPEQHELLDWLAVDFMENGWSMKRLHRLLVTSQTYRLASATRDADPATRQNDPENRFYWRRFPVRMQSQAVRDSLLHLAGALDPQLGGPSVDPNAKTTTFRRSLYFTHSRDSRDRFVSMFDDADILACYRRSESIVPQQALALANSELSFQMARRIAERLDEQRLDEQRLDEQRADEQRADELRASETRVSETRASETPSSDSPAQASAVEATQVEIDQRFIAAAFETILCRPPMPAEVTACQAALSDWATAAGSSDASGAREHLVHVLLNHNDFVTIR